MWLGKSKFGYAESYLCQVPPAKILSSAWISACPPYSLENGLLAVVWRVLLLAPFWGVFSTLKVTL